MAGAANGMDNTTAYALQKRVPDALLGRVFSVRFFGYGAAEALAYAAGGLVVDAVGPRPAYLLAGVATAVAGLGTPAPFPAWPGPRRRPRERRATQSP